MLGSHGGESFSGSHISAVSDVVFQPHPFRTLESRGQYGPVVTDERLGLSSRFRFAWFRERVVNERVDRLTLERTDEAFIQLCHRRHLASAEALDLRERDLLVWRRFTRADLQALLDSFQQRAGSLQNAWQTRAHAKLAPAERFGVKHVVEGDNFAHVGD